MRGRDRELHLSERWRSSVLMYEWIVLSSSIPSDPNPPTHIHTHADENENENENENES